MYYINYFGAIPFFNPNPLSPPSGRLHPLGQRKLQRADNWQYLLWEKTRPQRLGVMRYDLDLPLTPLKLNIGISFLSESFLGSSPYPGCLLLGYVSSLFGGYRNDGMNRLKLPTPSTGSTHMSSCPRTVRNLVIQTCSLGHPATKENSEMGAKVSLQG